MMSEECAWYAGQLATAIGGQESGTDKDGDYLSATLYSIEAKTAGLRSSLDFHERLYAEAASGTSGSPDPRPHLREDIEGFEAMLANGRSALRVRPARPRQP